MKNNQLTTLMDLTKQIRVHNGLALEMPKFDFTKLEYDIFVYLLAKLSKEHKDSDFYYLDLGQLEKITGIQYNQYEFIEAVRKLRKKEIIIPNFVLDGVSGTLIDGLISSAHVVAGKKTMRVRITPEMKPLLIGLNSNFTQIQLYAMLHLKSKFAKKVYLYLSKHKPDKGIVRKHLENVTIEDFKKDIGLFNEEGKEQFKKITDLKEYVLDLAVQQINQVSDIKVQYHLEKLSREYFFINWDIEAQSNKVQVLEFQELADTTTKPQILAEPETFTESIDRINLMSEMINGFGFDEKLAQKATRRFDNKMLRELMVAVAQEIEKLTKAGKPVNRAKYLYGAIAKKFEKI